MVLKKDVQLVFDGIELAASEGRWGDVWEGICVALMLTKPAGKKALTSWATQFKANSLPSNSV